MSSLGEVVQNTVGFVKFRGKWIPRLLAWHILSKLLICNGSEGRKMSAELVAALYVNDKVKKK